jgi:hypothetical protein
MPDRSSKSKPKRPRDPNQLAAFIVGQAVGDIPRDSEIEESGKNPAAVALGRLGGNKGGIARAQSLSASERKQIAKKAAKARWGRSRGKGKKSPSR